MKPNSGSFNQTDIQFTESLDSLQSKRGLFSTSIFQGDTKLRPKTVASLLKEDTLARRQYRWGRRITPIGPLMSAAGIALGYVALKGKPASANIEYNNQPITANYTVRSLPQLAAGLALFVGGVCLVEFSNELIGRSVKRFNATPGGTRSAAHRPSLHYGITPGGNLGLYARF